MNQYEKKSTGLKNCNKFQQNNNKNSTKPTQMFISYYGIEKFLQALPVNQPKLNRTVSDFNQTQPQPDTVLQYQILSTGFGAHFYSSPQSW
jgi:hypothetical protein